MHSTQDLHDVYPLISKLPNLGEIIKYQHTYMHAYVPTYISTFAHTDTYIHTHIGTTQDLLQKRAFSYVHSLIGTLDSKLRNLGKNI
jgi:hypothetical protein